MRFSRIDILTSLLAVYLTYSTIANYSVYYIGLILTIAIFLLLCFCVILFCPSLINGKRMKNLAFFIFGWGFIMLMSIFVNGIFPRALFVVGFITCMFFLSLNVEALKSIFRKYVWILSLLFLLSAIEYIIYIVSGKGIIVTAVTRVTEARTTYFYHYLFNIITVHDVLYRFKGLCAEPGNMGTLCALMLFATWRIKTLRFPFYVFLVCGLMSLSLAYYIFLTIFLLTNVKPNIKNFVIGLLVFAAFIFVFRDFFEYRIVNRLTEVDDIEELDNRTTEIFDRYFYNAYDKGDLWLGVGSDNLPPQIYSSGEGGNAGAKKWIFQYGIIGLFIIFCIYMILYCRIGNKRLNYYDWVFLFVYWAAFFKGLGLLSAYLFIIYLMMPIINKKETYIL